ncbi:hypothetical protein ASD65_18420 [Microbacterium sp. Root61]|uniref:regulatory protein RecX n=1 Tax=Microbacterium sp. Root61 TaxID=1736570 RepID=UPI0006F7376C|nr:regulatory protein RecX [Microbacterium sp. Root61]KRA22446.1 hypothetical protein ASD65_18420 [Microbacterium sp. Root61]
MSASDGHEGERWADEPGLAPVTYLPGVRPQAPRRPTTVSFTESAWADDEPDPDGASGGETAPIAEPAEPDRDAVVAAASVTLTRSLGRRGLSLSEAAAKLRTAGLSAEEASDVVEDFVARGWLDDAVLAEQLVHSATTRQDKGTKAIRQLLQKRMLAREVIDAVIAELPDDDAERALEFAQGKARALTRYDDDTATRRLMGMLARRGFGGSIAGTAARRALAEARAEAGGGSGVRFR